DATLIAADINNYLYASNGTPNQIPVISLFQDVDYEHKLFTRHAAQVLDGNNVETYEPRVLDIVLYNTVKSGTSLTTCQTYYSVPTEDLTAKWVSKTGNDTTGNGTKALPYLTIEKAYKTFPTGTKVYVKSGSYTEEYNTTTIRYFYFDTAKTFEISGLGRCEILTISTTYVIRVVALNMLVTFNNFIFNGESNTTHIFDSSTNASKVVLNKCRLLNPVTNYINSPAATGYEYELTNSMGVGSNTGYIRCISGVKLYGCLINKGYVLNANSIKYCKITATDNQTFAIFTGSNMEFFNNKISAQRSVVQASGAVATTIKVNYNTITYTWISSIGASQSLIYVANSLITPEIKYNKISLLGTNVTDYIYCINFLSCTNPIVNYNNINIESKVKVSTFEVSPSSSKGKITFNYNYIKSNKEDATDISVGGETTEINRWDGSEFIGNRYIGYKRNYPLDTTGVSVHAFLINASINNIIKYNYISETDLGLVVKTGLQQAYTSGGVSYNLFSDCRKSIWARGVGALNVYNNIFHHSGTTYGKTFENALYADENITAGNYCEHITLRNNIYKITPSSLQANVAFDEHAASNGSTIENEIVNGGSYVFQANVTKYTTITLAQVAGWMNNSASSEVTLVDIVPQLGGPQIGTGVTLDSSYDDGLDASTTWGSDTEVPNIVTKQQGTNWDIGAYVH
ncbi:MAG TPA: hypothetical protein VK153_01035, partial [Candidatus Paceibacterota bacterium]|nr:hypothetical protein [Candidatus Paceibacterota bacterium]